MKRALLLFFTALLINSGFSAALHGQSIAERTSDMEFYDGFFNFWWDDETGKIWLEIERFGEEFLYVNSLAAGVGSNDIGLDRSQLGNTRIVRFDRVGPKVLMVQPNYSYRASSGVRLEEKSVKEAFAESILFGFTIEAGEGDRVLVDATDFLMQDAHGVSSRLRSSSQGNFTADLSRSAIYLPGTFNFPKNSEFETTLTFTGNGAGRHLRSVAPSADAITVRQHHSFVELPDDDYEPRKFDLRSGYFNISYQDYSAAIGDELVQRYTVRHRLKKKNPDAAVSEPVNPIIYYLDNGTPEPIRTALLDGARWWNEAFEAAGYENAFQVEILPDDAHPLDIRYNVINWVHRSTRGWSYGSSVVDPRTGEIMKGNVLLGSLRVRQDYLIAEGLLAPYEEGADPDPEMLEMALNRIRQLSAHEIGHTLGIAHNFAASVNDLASVMDYPHPRVQITNDGELSLENAYDLGIGEWDKRAVMWGYGDFGEEASAGEALGEIIEETTDMGLLYISDEAARPQGGAHPDAHLWEYGSDPIHQLGHILEVREIALRRFGEQNIREGRPMSDLQNVLVPVYLFHRYQTEAAVKLLGGVDYSYQLRGDGQAGPQIVDANRQRNALSVLLRTLDPEVLALPEHIQSLIPPVPARISQTREQFQGYMDPVLDPLAMAEVAADHSASLLFNPQRSARLIYQHAVDRNYPGFHDAANTVLNSTILSDPAEGYTGAVQRAINISVLRSLINLAGSQNISHDVQAVSWQVLENLQIGITEKELETLETSWRAHYNMMLRMIGSFFEKPSEFTTPPVPYVPPGAPIGSEDVFSY